MASKLNPAKMGEAADSARRHAPATARNRDFILEVLEAHLPSSGMVLEVASGTGEHTSYFATKFKGLTWQPTDLSDDNLITIEAWRAHVAAENILPARKLDVTEADWDLAHLSAPLSAILAINLIHISPWAVAEALIAGAGDRLTSGGVLYLYGPYKRDGAHTSDSNASFDMTLKSRDPSWGIRDMEAVISLAMAAGFGAPEIVPMPANNFSLVFRKL